MRRRLVFLAAVGITLVLLVFLLRPDKGGPLGDGAQAQQEDPAVQRILQLASERSGAPQERLIAYVRPAVFPLTGAQILNAKVYDRETGRRYAVSTDLQGNVVDRAQVEAAEKAAYDAKYGKLSPAVHERLSGVAPEEAIPVVLWLAGPDVSDLTRPTRDERAGPYRDEVSRRNLDTAAPVLQALQGLGAQGQATGGAPIVSAVLTPGQIEAISHHPGVATVYLETPVHERIDHGTTESRATYVWRRGITGNGTVAGILEGDRPVSANPYLNNATHPMVVWPAGTGVEEWHATNVAGVIASTDGHYRGTAWEVDELAVAAFGGGNIATQVNAWNWLADPQNGRGAASINMSYGPCSYGAQDAWSRTVDYQIKTYGDNAVAAVANTSNCDAQNPDFTRMQSPEVAWNVIAVGGFHDNNTTSWGDDGQGTGVWRNPLTSVCPNLDCERPDLTGLGVWVNSTNPTSPWVGGSASGTSFAAPEVAGAVNLIVDRDPNLGHAAETVKAILMAGAVRNLAGPVLPDPRDATDDWDGAGAVMPFHNDNIVQNGWYRYPQWVTPASFGCDSVSPCPVTIDQTFSAVAGENVRVVLTWDSTADSGGTSDVLNADLDCRVHGPGGFEAGCTNTFDSSAEWVQFVAPSSGTYTISVEAWRFDPGTNTIFGLAWNRFSTADIGSICQDAAVHTSTFLMGWNNSWGNTFWDSYPVSPWTEDGRETIERIDLSQTSEVDALFYNIGAMTGDLDLFILDGCDSADAIAVGNTEITVTLSPGTYYVVVDGYNKAISQYSLAVYIDPVPTVTPTPTLTPVPTVTPTPTPIPEFSGRVYAGNVGDESTPLSGVTVDLYCSNNAYPDLGNRIGNTSTDGTGWYGLPASSPCEYYNILETDPLGHVSQGATTVDGAVLESNWIQYTHPLGGKTLTGNKFWDIPVDTDGDGCTDAQEAAMGFNPNAWWDFYDVPVPANPDPASNGSRDRVVDIKDTLAVLLYAFAEPTGACGDNANASGVDYDCDKNSDSVADGLDYDRSAGPDPSPPWDAGPPNDVVDIRDVLAALAQAFVADCSE